MLRPSGSELRSKDWKDFRLTTRRDEDQGLVWEDLGKSRHIFPAA